MGPVVNFNPRAYRETAKDNNNKAPAVRANAESLSRTLVSQKASAAIQAHPMGTMGLRMPFEGCISRYFMAVKYNSERALFCVQKSVWAMACNAASRTILSRSRA